jgi:hypothetical protein
LAARSEFVHPLSILEHPVMSRQRKIGLTVLRQYLLIAFILTTVKIDEVAAASTDDRRHT